MGQRLLQVAIVGAESPAGRDLYESLAESLLPMEAPRLLSAAGATEEAAWWDDEEEVRPLEPGSLRDVDLIFVLAPGADEAVRQATSRGAVAIAAPHTVAAPDAPMIFPGVNDEDLDDHEDARLFQLPTAAAAQIAAVLLPLEAKVRVEAVEVVALEAVAGAAGGLDELSTQTVDLLSGKEPSREAFPQRIAFNLIPQGAPGLGASTEREAEVAEEVGKLLGGGPASVSITTSWAPIFHGNTHFVTARTATALSAEAAREALQEEEGLKVLDDPEHPVAPMPMLAVGDEAVHVGRLRQDGGALRWISAADGLRFGVVAPMIALARELIDRGAVGKAG